jgi:hypothetical protein
MNSSCQSDLGIISIKIERITPTDTPHTPHENALNIQSSQNHSPEKTARLDSFAKNYTDHDRSLFNQELANRLNTVIPRMMKIQSVDGIIDDVAEEYVDEHGSFSRRRGSVINRSPTRHYQRESSEERFSKHDSENRRSYEIERLNSIDHGERYRHDENRTNSGSIRSSNIRNGEVYAQQPEYNDQKNSSFSNSIKSNRSNMRKTEVYAQHPEYNEKSIVSRRPSRSPTEHR